MPRHKKVGSYRFGELKIVERNGTREPVRILKMGKAQGKYKVLFLNLNNDIKETVKKSELKEPLRKEKDTTEAEKSFRDKELKHRASYLDSDTDTDSDADTGNAKDTEEEYSKRKGVMTTSKFGRQLKKHDIFDPSINDDDTSSDRWDGHISHGNFTRDQRIENDKYNNHVFCEKCHYVKHSKYITSSCRVDGLPHTWVQGQTEAEQIEQYEEDSEIIKEYKNYDNITSTGYAEDGFVEDDSIENDDDDYVDTEESCSCSENTEYETDSDVLEIERELETESYEYHSNDDVNNMEEECRSEEVRNHSDSIDLYSSKDMTKKKYGTKYGTKAKKAKENNTIDPDVPDPLKADVTQIQNTKAWGGSAALKRKVLSLSHSLNRSKKPSPEKRDRIHEEIDERHLNVYPILYSKLEWAYKMHSSGYMTLDHYQNIEKSVYDDMMVSVYSTG